MDAEPPPDYVEFVARHLGVLKSEAARLVGNPRYADELYPEVLSDVAGHWRRLHWWCRLGHPNGMTDFLRRRLATRTKQWREDQIYPVEIRVSALPVPAPFSSSPADLPAPTIRRAAPDSVARRLAPLLPTTVRAEASPMAEAAIAWLHAYQRYCWRRAGRLIGGTLLTVGAIVQVMSRFSAS
jgi:hypothetical protein